MFHSKPILRCLSIFAFLAAASLRAEIEKYQQIEKSYWQGAGVESGDYVGLATMSHPDRKGTVCMLRNDGAVEWLSAGTGSHWWKKVPLVDGKFVAICGRINPDGSLFGVDDKGLSWITYDGGWKSVPVWPGEYAALAARNVGEDKTGVFALKKNGSIERIDKDGGDWRATPVIDGGYVALGTAWDGPDQIFAVKKGEGVDLISFSNGGWQAKPLLKGDFVAVAGDPNRAASNAFFAIRTNGDLVYAQRKSGVVWSVEKLGNTKGTALAEVLGKESGVFVASSGDQAKAANTPKKFPKIPEFIYGINQYSVGDPKDEGGNWPMRLPMIQYLKQELGLNMIRIPVYPNEVGIDPYKLSHWKVGEPFDPEKADREWKFDWRSLDAVLDILLEAGVTPQLDPSIEDGKDWRTKLWLRLYHPENFDRCRWFTIRMVEHVNAKYGDQVSYGWYENWWWFSRETPEKMNWRLLPEFRQELSVVYKKDIAALNKNWGTNYASFDVVELPDLLKDIPTPPNVEQILGGSNFELTGTRKAYDYRLVLDRIFLRNLKKMGAEIKKVSPGALWCGPSGCNEICGLYDIATAKELRMNASLMTLAQGSDVLFLDQYGPPAVLKVNYRTAAKIAHFYGKKILVAEICGRQINSFSAVAESGGPSRGALIWAGMDSQDESQFGIVRFDGSIFLDRMLAAKRLGNFFRKYPRNFSEYRPGRLLVYTPMETWSYAVLEKNYVDAYARLFETIPAEDIEPVLTEELKKLPADVPIYVFDKVLPRQAIEELNRRGRQVVCPHSEFIDENGEKIKRSYVPSDFFGELTRLRDGMAMYEAFRVAVDKEKAVTYPALGAEASGMSELAEKNLVLEDRPNIWINAIDGSVCDGVTFATKAQNESVDVRLAKAQPISSAFVDFYQGDGQKVGPSRLPRVIRILGSEDNQEFREIGTIATTVGKYYYSEDFPAVSAKYLRFDFGYNDGKEGIRLANLGAY